MTSTNCERYKKLRLVAVMAAAAATMLAAAIAVAALMLTLYNGSVQRPI